MALVQSTVVLRKMHSVDVQYVSKKVANTVYRLPV